MSNTKPVAIVIDEYTMPSGDEVTLQKNSETSFDVDMWRPNGDNHFSKWFNTEAKARVEFERWRN